MIQINQIFAFIRNAISKVINFLDRNKKNIFIVILKFFVFNLCYIISYKYYQFDAIFNVPIAFMSASVFINIINHFPRYLEIYCNILQFIGEEISDLLSMTISSKLVQYYFYCFDYVKKSFTSLMLVYTENNNFVSWISYSSQLNLFIISFFPLLILIRYIASKILFAALTYLAFLAIFIYNIFVFIHKYESTIMKILYPFIFLATKIRDLVFFIMENIIQIILICVAFYFFRNFFKAYLRAVIYSIVLFVVYGVYQLILEKISKNKLNSYSIMWMCYFLNKKIIVLKIWVRFFGLQSIFHYFNKQKNLKSPDEYNFLQLLYLFIQSVRIIINFIEICIYVYKGASKRIRSELIIATVLFPI